MTRSNRAAVVGAKLAPRKRPAYRTRTEFLDPDTKSSQNWRTGALCLQIGNPELWFSELVQDKEVATATCYDCPVRPQCLIWALHSNQRHGIWGGFDLSDRRILQMLNDEKEG